MSLGVCHAVTLCVFVRCISLGGEGNAPYPVLPSFVFNMVRMVFKGQRETGKVEKNCDVK